MVSLPVNPGRRSLRTALSPSVLVCRRRRLECRRCSGLQYECDARNHSPVYLGFIRPREALRRASLALLRCRSAKKRGHFREQVDTARTKLAEFSAWWHGVAVRVVEGRAGKRNERHFRELSNLLLKDEERYVIENSFGEPDDRGPDIRQAVDLRALADEVVQGGNELLDSSYSEAFRQAARDPTRRTIGILAAVITYRLSRHHKQELEQDDPLGSVSWDPVVTVARAVAERRSRPLDDRMVERGIHEHDR